MRSSYKHILLVALCLLSACSDTPVPEAKKTTGRLPTLAEVPSPDETVRGENEPSIVTLDVGAQLKQKKAAAVEDLPAKVIIPNTNLRDVPVTVALQAVLSGTDVTLAWNNDSYAERIINVANLSGPLPTVVEKICGAARIFCDYHHGMLELKDKETFIIELPNMPSKDAKDTATNTMAQTIEELAGDKVRLDEQGGNLIYTTDVAGDEKVRQYLLSLRNGRPLVVLQLYIWEVTLTKDNGVGINWSNFKIPKIGGGFENLILQGSTAFTGISSPGVTLNASFNGAVDSSVVLKFLTTQGQVQTISNPQMTFVSGQTAEFRVGGKRSYISQVGQLTTGSVTGSNATSTGIGTNTISTDTIETGLTVEVGGSYENGIINANMEISTQDIVNLNPTVTSGVTIDLPETAERKVASSIRVRPGDNLVMAGLVTSRDESDREGIPLPFGFKIPTSDTNSYKNTELVILVKPSVVLFSDKSEAEKPKNGTGKSNALGKSVMEYPDAIYIDKDGVAPVSVMQGNIVSGQPVVNYTEQNLGNPAMNGLGGESAALPAQSFPTGYKMGEPLSLMPALPKQNEENRLQTALVGQQFMQRGLSHAFDQMRGTEMPPDAQPDVLTVNADIQKLDMDANKPVDEMNRGQP